MMKTIKDRLRPPCSGACPFPTYAFAELLWFSLRLELCLLKHAEMREYLDNRQGAQNVCA